MTSWIAPLLTGPTARRRWRWLLAALVLFTLWMALSPRPPQLLDTGWDKSNHVLAFLVLSAVAEAAFRDGARARWRAMLGLLALAGAIELLQLLVPGRTSEWADLLSGALGIAAGTALAHALLAQLPTRPG